MRTFENQAAQGDVLFTKIDKLPDGLVKQKSENGKYVIAHSETGHNHVMREHDVDVYYPANDNFVAYIVVNNDTKLLHERSFDTHAPIKFKKGIYRVNKQREYTPEGFRRAQD